MIPKADLTCLLRSMRTKMSIWSYLCRQTEAFRQKQMYLLYEMCVHMPVHARKVSQLMTSIAAAALKKACSIEKENELFI